MVDRAISLSHRKFHQKNLTSVKEILINNDYPLNFIESNIRKRMKKLRFNTSSNNNGSRHDDNNNDNNNNRKHLFSLLPEISLPYNSHYTKLSNCLKEYNISTVSLINKNLNTVVKLGKDISQKEDRTNVVYEFNCKQCPATYIGETKRAMRVRIGEHQKNKNPDSVVFQHCEKFSHEFNWSNVKILDSEPNLKKRIISEMIQINSNFFTINKKEDIIYLNKIFFPLLRKLDS